MRTPDRDRCRSAVALLCIAYIVLGSLACILPCEGVTVVYQVSPDGNAYNASVLVENSTGYQFFETGPLGERLPVRVTNVSLTGDCSPCTFNRTGDTGITYPKGNYTILFGGPVHENHLATSFDDPSNVTVTLPKGLDVRNQFLGVISPGGEVNATDNTSVTVHWTGTKTIELRFYDQGRESLLYLFAYFWLAIAFVLITPYLLSMNRKQK